MGIADGQDEQKRALLAAMAQAGNEGVAQYKASQAQVAGYQQDALKSQAQQAALLKLDAPMAANLAGVVGQPGALAGSYLGAGQDRFARDIARQTQANSDYMAQAAAAVPAIKAYGDTLIGLAKQKWEAQKAKEQAAMSRQDIVANATGAAEAARQKDIADTKARQDALLAERAKLDKEEATARSVASIQPGIDAILSGTDPRITSGVSSVLAGTKPATVAGSGWADKLIAAAAPAPDLAAIQKRREAIDAEIARLGGTVAPDTSNPAPKAPMGPPILGAQAMRTLPPPLVAALPPAERQVPQPYVYQRQATVGMGYSPEFAAGVFQPPTPQEQASELNAQQALLNYAQYGAASPQAAAAADRAADPVTYALAAKAGLNPREVPTIRASDPYQQAKQMAEDFLLSKEPRSFDDLKYALNGNFYKDPKVIALVLAEYQGRWPSPSGVTSG